VRGAARVQTETMDANDIQRHAALLDNADAELGGLDTVLIAHGTLSDQAACQQSVALTFQELRPNREILNLVEGTRAKGSRFARPHGTDRAGLSNIY
jgi:hypothetical protein